MTVRSLNRNTEKMSITYSGYVLWCIDPPSKFTSYIKQGTGKEDLFLFIGKEI